MPEVVNLVTGLRITYDASIPARDAVRLAHLQFTTKTWASPADNWRMDSLKVWEGQHSVACGNWSAWKDREEIDLHAAKS